MSVKQLAHDLLARLPELEWQLNKVDREFLIATLPPYLLHAISVDTPLATVFIAEIRREITMMTRHANPRIQHYLAKKISEKITILVTSCTRFLAKEKPVETAELPFRKLSTREEWLSTFQAATQQLNDQKAALLRTLEQKQHQENPMVLLNLQKELGEIEKRLTLMRDKNVYSIAH